MTSETYLRDEENLLLELCRLEFSREQLDRIRSRIALINDWDYFRNLVSEHGVPALIWHNLEKYQLITGIPEETALFLRGAMLKSLSRNTFNRESMAKALRLLNMENIKTVILKGLALEKTVYGDSGLRQMSDVDILIDRKEAVKAAKILIGDGYESLPVKSVFHEFITGYSGKHLPSLIKNGTSVEIHIELFGGEIIC